VVARWRCSGSVMVLAVALLALFSSPGMAQVRATQRPQPQSQPQHVERVDSRFNHNRPYPVRGLTTPQLPASAIVARHGSVPYYFDHGSWYRPVRGSYTVVAAPLGIVLPTLPPFYTTVWFGDTPYYYANDTYYLWSMDQDGYVVTAPPQDPDASPPADFEQLYVDPNVGQSAAQQAKDRNDCHAWARQQSGFDPTLSPDGNDDARADMARSQYLRAERSCLESRGYTVR
jgi:hypothetical protein